MIDILSEISSDPQNEKGDSDEDQRGHTNNIAPLSPLEMGVGGDSRLVVLNGLNLQLLPLNKCLRDFSIPFKHLLQTVGYLLLGGFHLLVGREGFVSVVLISIPLSCEFS